MVTTLAGRFRGVSRAERKAAVGWTRVAWRGGAPQARKLGKSQGRGCASNGGPSEGASSRSSPYPPTLARDRWSLPGRQYMSWTRVRYVRNPSQSFHVRKRALYAPGASELSAGSPCSLCRAALRPAYPNRLALFAIPAPERSCSSAFAYLLNRRRFDRSSLGIVVTPLFRRRDSSLSQILGREGDAGESVLESVSTVTIRRASSSSLW